MVEKLRTLLRPPWWIGSVIGAAAIISFALFVWPTPYRYDHIRSDGISYPVRTHRITGRTERFTLDGWGVVEPTSIAPTRGKTLPSTVVEKLDGSLELSPSGWLKAEVYNASPWTVHHINVYVTLHDSAHNVIFRDREYVLSRTDGTGAPHTSSSFGARAFRLEPGQTYSAQVVGAVGE
jgi:hypothetical protein